jgi:hypothetical protein
MTLLLFLKRTKEIDRTANKERQVDSSLVCVRSQALELTGHRFRKVTREEGLMR